MRPRIYLDTHVIDYMWDYRREIWDDETDARHCEQSSSSVPVPQFAALVSLPTLAWLNDCRLIVGDEVLKELSAIRRLDRRTELVAYANQLRHLGELGLDEGTDRIETVQRPPSDRTGVQRGHGLPMQPPPPGFQQLAFERKPVLETGGPPSQLIDDIPVSDRRLVQEAIGLDCDIFLTSDIRLIRRGERFEHVWGLRFCDLDQLAIEQAGDPDAGASEAERLYPDLLLYTGMIPGGLQY